MVDLAGALAGAAIAVAGCCAGPQREPGDRQCRAHGADGNSSGVRRELFSRKERKERKDCGRVDVGDVLTQRRRDAEYAEMFSRVEHVERVDW